MPGVLVDSNILIDMLAIDSPWSEPSTALAERLNRSHTLIINPIIYAEVSVGFADTASCDVALACPPLQWEDFSRTIAHLASRTFLRYRRAGGTKLLPLPDFFIGAHAKTAGHAIATRDAGRYRNYFPEVELLTP